MFPFPFNVSEDEMSAATAAAASLSSLLASTAASTNGANGNRPKSPPETPNRLAPSSPQAPAAAPLNGGGGGDSHLRSSSSPGISYEGMVSVMSARGTGGPSAGNAASDAEVSTTRENDSSPPSAGSSSRFDIY